MNDILKIILKIIIILMMSFTVSAQVKTDTELYKTIMSKDSLLFSIGFNTCDVHQFENLLSEDFEFFHDKDSISLKSQFLYGIKNGLCKSPSTYQSRRALKASSTEIYPMNKKGVLYGAIQMGVHSFYENIAGQKEAFGSTAKFTHVWLLQNGTWQLARSLSYDHQTGE